MRFLNTTDDTSMGPGVGLEVGNSIYFDMAPGHFSYWNATEADREKIRALIRSGHIDVLHSYGDLATTRAHAARALEELHRHDCHFKVWVDHAQAPSNFGADIMQGHGDEPGHPVYHADLTFDYGIEYIWRGRVTSFIGQNRPFNPLQLVSDLLSQPSTEFPLRDGERVVEDRVRYSGSLSAPLAHLMGEGGQRPGEGASLPSSLSTLAKECAKQILARTGSEKYALHADNAVLNPCQMRDGRKSIEFLRCNPHWGGVSCADRGDRIHEVLTKAFLDRLVETGGACILYTHLGKLGAGPYARRFSPGVVAAFRLLAEYAHGGKILVTTTRRLLDRIRFKGLGRI